MLLQSSKLMYSPPPAHGSLTTSIYKTFLNLLTHLHILYLFTSADFPTFALPTTLFALSAALSGPLLTTNAAPSPLTIFSLTPLALLTIWLNLLIFNMSNQRSPHSIAEDAINKPSRPLPQGLITPNTVRQLLLLLVPCTLTLGWLLGVWQETALLLTFTWMYNELQGSDESFVLRNALIAVGYGLYFCLALRVMLGPAVAVSQTGWQWLGIVTGVILVTQHICDIKDVPGDRLRGRQSAPIVLGDEGVRWSVSVPILGSSMVCPAFFGLGWKSHVCIVGMGVIVAGRTMVWRDLDSDKKTWKLWALWSCGLFVLPAIASPGVLEELWCGIWGLVCLGGECDGALNLAAVSGVAIVVEGRRLYEQERGVTVSGNETVPKAPSGCVSL